jgi:hypothetical protein
MWNVAASPIASSDAEQSLADRRLLGEHLPGIQESIQGFHKAAWFSTKFRQRIA